VGIIGIGWFALMGHAPRLREMSNTEIVAIARRNSKALADAQDILGVERAYTDWRRLLDRSDLDAVIVTTPHHVHTEPTLAALERGLHVLVEKPMALTSRDAWAMVEAAEQANRVLMVGYNRRCEGCWRAVAQALKAGRLGTIRQVNLSVSYNFRWIWEAEHLPPRWQELFQRQGVPRSFFNERLEGSWRRDPAQMGGGEFADSGSHFVDLALWLGGAPPIEVVALATSAGLPVEAHLGIQARLANDVLLSLSLSDGVPAGTNHLTVRGDLGTVTADWPLGQVPEFDVHRAQGRQNLAVEIPDTTTTAAFVDTILEDMPNLSPARDGAYAVALTEAVYRSIAEKRIIYIDSP
jgi:predicted dehydrogenase